MQSFIIASKNDEKTQEYIDELTRRENISIFDITTITPESSIGIKEIRELQTTLYLKPSQGSKKLIVLRQFDTATLEAQNSMLKLLEEPPPHLIILLITPNPDTVLPTIQSRCTIVTLDESSLSPSRLSSQHPDTLLLSTAPIGERLKLAQKNGKTKEEALVWIEALIHSSRQTLLRKTDDTQSLYILRLLHKAYFLIRSTNVSPRMILEDVLLKAV